MKRHLAILGLLTFSQAVLSAEIGAGYTCKATQSPERIVRSLINDGVLFKQWFANEDSVAYYETSGSHTAFGFPLVAVAAFEEGSAFFGRSPGTSPGNRIAIVVMAPLWQVRQALQKQKLQLASRNAGTFPNLSVESYANEFPEPLPKSVKPNFVFTQVLCRPHN